jgi:exosortase H (IPTLxxWG-CTERM-specific)
LRREQKVFLLRFIAVLVFFYLVVAIRPVNDHVVVPFTGLIVRVSAAVLRGLGEPTQASGTLLASPAFAVDVKNGCNGVEAMLLLVAAMLAFPASARQRLVGLAAGVAAVQIANLARVVSLFWLGVHHRAVFELFHAAVWQTALILLSVVLFVLWSRRVGPAAAAPSAD